MSMKRTIGYIILAIFLVAFITVGAYAFNPSAKATLDYYLGPTGYGVSQTIINGWIGLTQSPTWLTYIAPTQNAFAIGMAAMLAITMLFLHPMWNKFTGFWASRHEYRIQTTPTVPITTSPPTATVRAQPLPPIEQAQVPTPTPTTQPKQEEKPQE